MINLLAQLLKLTQPFQHTGK